MDRMNRKYIFLADFSSDALNSALMGHLFGDLQDVKNVDIVKLKRHTPKTKFGRLFERLYYSRKINSIIHLPFHWIASGLSQYDFDDNPIVRDEPYAPDHQSTYIKSRPYKKK